MPKLPSSASTTRAGFDAGALMEAATLEVISVQAFEWVRTSKTPHSIAYPELLRRMLGPEGIA
ncbi:hypothetical protein C8A00DRAFT_31128, partial [Chaetomidium leptoderma]